ncbi:MAG: hypothetical protein LC785_03915 [Acidobacteria bacterium]|nr:hypothetical protein [Acidobacteriota bacterium]MCA1641130.1 hypothetical protein [Acidobacteriota bacterium]
METPDTLLLSRSDVSALLTLDECIPAVEEAFRLHAEGKSLPPGVLGVHARGGGNRLREGRLVEPRLKVRLRGVIAL